MSNVVLIGFMGSGKTTYGKKVAKILGYEFIDTDDYIERMEGMKISQIFEQKGETYFRNLEKELCLKLSKEDGKVIATGGGIVKNDENMENLKKNGVIIHLNAKPETIYARLKNDNTRPLLMGDNKEEKIRNILEERKELYAKHRDAVINVDEKSIYSIINDILDAVR